MARTIRPIIVADQPFVTAMQFEALFVPPGAEPFARTVLDEPSISRYHVGFGTRPGDAGVLAEDATDADVAPIGAAWVRLVTDGYASVQVDGAAVPELGIAVVAAHRNCGASAPTCCGRCAPRSRCAASASTIATLPAACTSGPDSGRCGATASTPW